MTDTELVAAIRRIITARVRGTDKPAADLARYDHIVGLVHRHPVTKPEKASAAAPLLRVAEKGPAAV